MVEPEFSEKAFWVVEPRTDATPDQLRLLGRALHTWLGHPAAARVYGLSELDAGQPPTSPAYYVLRLPDGISRESWPVALLTVWPGADEASAAAFLNDTLAACRHLLADFMDPETYDAWTR